MIDDPLVGRQLANFRVERIIGRGGMAQVYYGVDVKLKRPVAIKVIDIRYRSNPSYAQRFVREAQTVATWRHENIIQIYYADDDGQLYYFVMEYIDGIDLGKLMSQHSNRGELIPCEEVLRIGRAVADALDYAHQRGVIHRDVKPANVLIANDGRVVLTDFGLVLDIEQGSRGEVFGSSHYIAPEQARRSTDAVPQSDLYALGVILYEMLTGKVPFDDPSPTTVALQHLTLEPPPPREINPNLGAQIEAVLLKALSKSPHKRYQTARALMDTLEKAIKADYPFSIEPSTQPSSVQMSDMATDDLIGQQLDEYRLDALLGRGGMARVYRGLDVHLKRWVAIKVIDNPFRTDSDYVMRFEREARAIAQLDHPHIVRLYRYGKANNCLYMAMQYIEGADLETVLATYREDGEFIEPEDASRIVREVCLALDYAHAKGVIHRDVKPSNIMLNKEGHAILTDFGLALLIEVGTRGKIFGSPHYISPEQAISSAVVVPQSDLYAVGVILYEMFTGELPFDAENPLDVAMLHMSEPPRPLRGLRPEISIELEAAILKALAKEPEDRYLSGAALAEALDKALRPTSDKARASLASASRASIPERVEAGLSKHPLPPIPAAVASPAPQQMRRRSAPTPAESLPDRIAVGSVTPSPSPPAPAPAKPSARGRWMIFGFGIILLILLVGIGVFLLSGINKAEGITQQVRMPQMTSDLAVSKGTGSAGSENLTTAKAQTEPLGPSPVSVLTTTATMTPQLSPAEAAETMLLPSATPVVLPTSTSFDTPAATLAPVTKPTATPVPTSPPTLTKAPTATSTAMPTATPTPELQLIADTQGDFSGTQGLSNWEYQWSLGRDSFDWAQMHFDGTCWHTTNEEQPVRICRDSGHPGLTGDIAWRWTSEVNGHIWVRVSAHKIDTQGGDGVVILVYRNTTELRNWQLGGNDSQGFTDGFGMDVAQGDLVFFVIKVGGDSTYDHTAFKAQIYR